MKMMIHGHAITEADLVKIADYMDDGLREELHAHLAPCTVEEFLSAYIDRAKNEDPGFLEILENEFRFEMEG